MRDHLDIEGHDDAVKAIERAVNEEEGLTEVFIRNLHRVLLKEPYRVPATTPDGKQTTRLITIGDYKTTPNNVITSTGETYYFTPPEQVKPAMSDLIDRYRLQETKREHPMIIATTFHYQFVRIHPFDDGNGRLARLLMNLILLKHGYTVAIVQQESRDRYLQALERADQTEELAQFTNYIAACCEYALKLYLRSARGESIEDPQDIDREIALLKRSLITSSTHIDQVALRSHIETRVSSIYSYCSSKIEAMAPGLFREWPVHVPTISGRSPDGNIFSTTLNESDKESIPEHAIDATITFQFSPRWISESRKGFPY